jgi:hypothetical protein
VINPVADWPPVTFAQLRTILIDRIGCQIEAAPTNLAYKPASRPITIFVRKAENGREFDWVAYHDDADLLSRGMVLNACRNLHIMLEALGLFAHLPTP